MRLFDAHIHLDDPRFAEDRDALLRAARLRGIKRYLIPGVTAATWDRTLRVAGEVSGAVAALGLHPYWIAEHRLTDVDALQARVRSDDTPIAIGECGLDFFLTALPRRRQQALFEAQLDLAMQCGLPVIVHARRALDEVIRMLRARPGLRAQLHSFAGSEQQAARLLDLGALLSIGEAVTYARAQRLHRIVRAAPLAQLCLETDAPDQPVAGRQGRRNEPVCLCSVAAAVARLRGMSTAELAAITTGNVLRFFAIPGAEVGDVG